MIADGLTDGALNQQHAAAIARGSTFKPQGVSEASARAYLDTNEGALYWYRLAEADPGALSSVIDDRTLEHITSGRAPRMETLGTHDPLVKFVAEGSSPSSHSPFWAKESEAEAAIASGMNISDFFGLPIGSEAPRYGMYRITPTVPTQVFINTVAPTAELGSMVTKTGGAEQALVPNRQLFTGPVYVKTVDNIPSLAPNLVRGASALGAATIAYDATTTAARTSDLLHAGNTTGAQSQVEHFAGRNLGMLGGAALGAELFGTAGAETGPFNLLIAGAGAAVGAVGGDKLASAYDSHRIYHQTDPQGRTWNLDPAQPQHGWTRTVTDAFAERGLSLTHVETAPPALAQRLTFQANNAAVELALGQPATPRDPWTQPADAQDRPSRTPAPWVRDAPSGHWSRSLIEAVTRRATWICAYHRSAA